ncbi:hypothetical protein AOQ84DRAFT_351294 [Glonium stellatum]|uniref:Uncharacterized protein n=1 Tax=Glonium stellatum TaxID=574774 RepID=A0A8E2FDA7_9PEZI|nr:hypothetical protein AOQ84DRAFT_351294 [Glonium stellatum]
MVRTNCGPLRAAILAQTSSSRLQSVSGFGVVKSSLTKYPPHSRPSWMPYLLGPLHPAELTTYLLEPQPAILPNIPATYLLLPALKKLVMKTWNERVQFNFVITHPLTSDQLLNAVIKLLRVLKQYFEI